MSDNLEKLFKSALQEATVEPPERVWEGIDVFLTKRQRLRNIYIRYTSIAASILLIFSVSYFINFRSQTEQVIDMAQFIDKIDHGVLSTDLIQQINDSEEIPEFTQFSKTTTLASNNTPQPQRVSPIQVVTDEKLIIINNKSDQQLTISNRILPIPLVNGNAITNQRKYNQLLAESTPRNTMQVSSSIKEPEIVKQKIKNNDLKFAVAGYFTPSISSGSYNVSEQNTRLAQFDEDHMSGLANMGGGLVVAVSPVKRFSIESGVNYSRVAQKTKDAPVYVPTRSTQAAFNKVDTEVFTPLGNVVNQAKATVYASDQQVILKDDISYDDSGTTGSLEQKFDYVEVPLLMRYYLNDNKLKFSVLGGFGANFLVKNHTYITYNDNTEYMGKTEDIRSFNMSTNFAIGIEYPVTKFLSIRIEPGFKYYLQSISRNHDLDFNPYSFNFSTGIGITF